MIPCRLATLTAASLIALLSLLAVSCCTSVSDDDVALIKALGKVPLFTGMDSAELLALTPAAKLRRAKAGEKIITQGKMLDRMYIVMDGGADVVVNGKKVTTLTGQPLVGEVEYVDPAGASADVIVLKDTDVLELNYAILTALMENDPRAGYLFMRELAKLEARRLRNMNPK